MKTIKDRFESKLSPKNPVTECIEWIGCISNLGYGQIKVDGKVVKAHRLAYELKHGPVPDGMDVLHRCDNRPCCNEAHLFLGTQADNIKDMVLKGRNPRGESHGRSKLSQEDVDEIRFRLSVGEKQTDLAKDFGIHNSQITRIKNRFTWKQNQQPQSK